MNWEKFKAFWLTLLHWHGWTMWLKWEGWKKIARWKGWTAWLYWSGWKKIGAWRGWRVMLFPHPAIVAILIPLSAAGLIWIFLTGQENSAAAYPLYCIAFYALITLVGLVVKLVPKTKRFIHTNPVLEKIAGDEEAKFRLGLYFEQIINFAYGAFKIISGAITGSAWIGADGLYNLAQGIMQLYQILRRRKVTTLTEQWKSYRRCGWMMIGLHLTMTGLVFQMIHMGRHEEYPGYMIFATATFTFYKLVSAFIDVAKDRKNKHPVDSSVRLLDLSQALYNLFALQVALLWEFGGGDFAYNKLMNSLTGGAVCLMVVAMGIYMLRRSRREMRKLEEENG